MDLLIVKPMRVLLSCEAVCETTLCLASVTVNDASCGSCAVI